MFSILILVLLGITLYIRKEQKTSDSKHYRCKKKFFFQRHTASEEETTAQENDPALPADKTITEHRPGENSATGNPAPTSEGPAEPPLPAEDGTTHKIYDKSSLPLSDDDIAEILLEDEEYLNTPDSSDPH